MMTDQLKNMLHKTFSIIELIESRELVELRAKLNRYDFPSIYIILPQVMINCLDTHGTAKENIHLDMLIYYLDGYCSGESKESERLIRSKRKSEIFEQFKGDERKIILSTLKSLNSNYIQSLCSRDYDSAIRYWEYLSNQKESGDGA